MYFAPPFTKPLRVEMTGTTQLCGTVRTQKSHLTATAETVALNTCFSQYQKHNNTKIYTSYCYVPCQVNIRTSSTRKGGQVKAESGTIDEWNQPIGSSHQVGRSAINWPIGKVLKSSTRAHNFFQGVRAECSSPLVVSSNSHLTIRRAVS